MLCVENIINDFFSGKTWLLPWQPSAHIFCIRINLNSAGPKTSVCKILSFVCITDMLECIMFNEKHVVTMATFAQIFHLLMDLNSVGTKTPTYMV